MAWIGESSYDKYTYIIKETIMSKVSSTKKQYRSMRGKPVDIDLLRKRNELTPAVGNAKVNARGDVLGAGGQIVKKREELIAEHYANAGTATPANLAKSKPAVQSVETVVEEPVKTTTTRSKKTATSVVEEELSSSEAQELEEMDGDWVEDKDGNFVPKSEA